MRGDVGDGVDGSVDDDSGGDGVVMVIVMLMGLVLVMVTMMGMVIIIERKIRRTISGWGSQWEQTK
jgi:ABC-type nickel/cobalt efflux system permease component RcnA